MHNNDHFWQTLYQRSQCQVLDQGAIDTITLNQSLDQDADVNPWQAAFVSSPAKGVRRLLLERDGGEHTTRATSIVAYAANSDFAAHMHPKGEEFLVLWGTFSDEHGDYPAGSYVRNPPGSRHRPFSQTGCLIYVKLQQFKPSDQKRIVIDSRSATLEGDLDKAHYKTLFSEYETVLLVDAKPNWQIPVKWFCQGIEILILSGELVSDQNNIYSQGHWLRQIQPLKIQSTQHSQLLIKYGHLA